MKDQYLPHVHLVGAGPGVASLMTVRGKEVLEQADVLIYDALASEEFLSWVPSHCEKIYVGKRSSQHALPQDEINQLLVDKAKTGKRIVRLKGGDPYVFGRGSEEFMALSEAGYDAEVVPGITSAIGGLSYAGIPITDRRFASEFTVFTGHENPLKPESSLDYEAIARLKGTKVILMGMSHLPQIVENLIKAGMDPDTPAAIVQWAGTYQQRSVNGTLKRLVTLSEKAGLAAPALIVIGGVASLQDELNWFEKLPLFGKKILVTRTREQAGALTHQLQQLGAQVYELPTIKIEAPTDIRAFAQDVTESHVYDWLVFSSPNGVQRFFDAFFAAYDDIRSIGNVSIAAIGPATAEKIKKYGLGIDLMPEKAVAEELIKAWKKRNKELDTSIEHQTILWVHGEQARDVISSELTKMGAIVDECIAYRTVPVKDDPTGIMERWGSLELDYITFTSSSTVDNFLALGLPIPAKCKIASIGPVTSKTIESHGLKAQVKAKSYDILGLVSAILAHAK